MNKKQSEQPWACPFCTSINTASSNRCKACFAWYCDSCLHFNPSTTGKCKRCRQPKKSFGVVAKNKNKKKKRKRRKKENENASKSKVDQSEMNKQKISSKNEQCQPDYQREQRQKSQNDQQFPSKNKRKEQKKAVKLNRISLSNQRIYKIENNLQSSSSRREIKIKKKRAIFLDMNHPNVAQLLLFGYTPTDIESGWNALRQSDKHRLMSPDDGNIFIHTMLDYLTQISQKRVHKEASVQQKNINKMELGVVMGIASSW